MSIESTTVCWSCWKSIGECICGSDSQPIEFKKPTETLPFCSTDAPEYIGGLIQRPCCVCGKSWRCDRDEWINGKCPHCGAQGSQVVEAISTESKNEIINSKDLKINFDKENNSLHLNLNGDSSRKI